MEAGARTIDLLWMGSLVAIPLAGIVGLACRTFVTRPATRHAMWVATLFSLVMPLLGAMVWEMPRVSSMQLRKVASTKLKLINPNVSNSVRHTLGKDHHETSPLPLASLHVGEETPSPEAGRPAPVTNACESSALSFAPSKPVDGLADLEACDTYSGNTPPQLWQAFATSIAPGVELSPAFLRCIEDSGTVSDALMPVSEGAMIVGASVCAADDMRVPTRSASSQIPTPLSPEPLLSPTPGDRTAQLVPAAERSLSAETSVFISAWIDRILLLRDSISTLPRMPTVVWLWGMLILAVLQAVRTWSAAKVLRSAVPASREVLAMVGALSEQVGLERAPATYFVTARVSPMIWCGLRPRLLVPQHLWESLDDHSRKAVLVHELAHLARKDHVLCWIENVIGAVYWWHPIVWFVRQRLRDNADASCDAWVTSLFPTNRRSYAEALLTTKSFVCTRRPDAGLFLCMLNDRTKVLSRRITMVMTQRTAPKISMIGAIAAALIVGVSAFVMPGLACPPEEASSGGGATAILARAPKAEKSKTTSQGSSARSPVPASQSSSGVTFFGEAPALEAMRANQSKQDFVVAPRAMTVWRSDDLASPGNSGMVAMSGPGPGTEPRTYRLPEGKLEALSSLMARQDVPIWVEPSDDHIVVHATAEQHAVFEGFVKMIHPEAPGTPRLANPFGRGQSRSATAVAGLAATGRLNELRAAAQSLEKNKRDIEREAERLRTTAEQQRDNSANLRDMARQLNEQAAAARDNAARDALRSTSNSLRSRSTALRNEADSMTKRIESLEVRIRQLEDSLEEIERKVEEAGDSEQSGTPSTSDGAFPEIVIEAPAAPSPPSPAVAPSIVPPPALH